VTSREPGIPDSPGEAGLATPDSERETRDPRLSTRGYFLRIVGKALLLFVAFDVLQAAVGLDRRLDSLSIYRRLVPPLARLSAMRDYPAGVMWPLGPLLDAHRIGLPKAPDEYRVAVLGDSGTFDPYHRSADAVPGQMTRLGVRVGQRRLIAYNLAYQKANAVAGLLILRHAVEKRTDAAVWFVSLFDLASDAPSRVWGGETHIIVRTNADELPDLVRRYRISTWETRRLVREEAPWRRSILFRGARYRDDALLLARSVLDLTSPGDPTESVRPERPWVGSYPLPAVPDLEQNNAADPPMPNGRWTTLVAGAAIARARGTVLLVVNDPIFVGSGPNADREYNSYYGKAIYDRYRRVLETFCRENAIPYLDLWSLVPPSEYADTPGHYTLEGNARIARAVTGKLSQIAR